MDYLNKRIEEVKNRRSVVEPIGKTVDSLIGRVFSVSEKNIELMGVEDQIVDLKKLLKTVNCLRSVVANLDPCIVTCKSDLHELKLEETIKHVEKTLWERVSKMLSHHSSIVFILNEVEAEYTKCRLKVSLRYGKTEVATRRLLKVYLELEEIYKTIKNIAENILSLSYLASEEYFIEKRGRTKDELEELAIKLSVNLDLFGFSDTVRKKVTDEVEKLSEEIKKAASVEKLPKIPNYYTMIVEVFRYSIPELDIREVMASRHFEAYNVEKRFNDFLLFREQFPDNREWPKFTGITEYDDVACFLNFLIANGIPSHLMFSAFYRLHKVIPCTTIVVSMPSERRKATILPATILPY